MPGAALDRVIARDDPSPVEATSIPGQISRSQAGRRRADTASRPPKTAMQADGPEPPSSAIVDRLDLPVLELDRRASPQEVDRGEEAIPSLRRMTVPTTPLRGPDRIRTLSPATKVGSGLIGTPEESNRWTWRRSRSRAS